MNHDINLNIHYSAPKEIWEKIEKIYESMPYWAGCYSLLKRRLTDVLGYEIGEPEEGYDFKYFD